MKHVLFVLVSTAVAAQASAQHWAAKCGGLGNERVVDVKADLSDAVISIGEFGPGSTVLDQPMVSQGLSDVFVVKQSAGGVLQWVRQAGGPGHGPAKPGCGRG